jgi:AcrR family transcriptional regulator
VAAAAGRFVADGYAGTTMEGVAADAGVAVQTVYYAFGTKAKLLAAVLDATIAGDAGPVAIVERDWVTALGGADDVATAVGTLVAEGVAIVARTAPVLEVVRGAASIPEVGELLVENRSRRRQDQRHLVDVLVATGLVPADAPRGELADVIYALLNEDVFLLLTRDCGWTVERVRDWVTSTLLDHLAAAAGRRPAGGT